MALSGYGLTLTLALALQLAGAPQRGDSMAGLIVGQVVDGDTGRPLSGTLVALTGPPGTQVPFPRILTGTDGRFVFRGLRRGSYNISALKPGFTEGAHGRTRPAGSAVPLTLADGERTGDVLVRLWKHASISGTVVDESGERLIGVAVQAYRRAVVSGRRRFVPVGRATTDDRGVYRVGGLIPGDYIVGAAGRHTVIPMTMEREFSGNSVVTRDANEIGIQPRGTTTQVVQVGDAGYVIGQGTPTPPPPNLGRLAIYAATFHPSAPAGEAASVVSLRSGEEHLSADMQLAPVPTVRVAGRVIGPEGLVTMTPLRLVASNTAEIGAESDAISTMTDRAGRFTFPAVPTGHYTLHLLRGLPAQSAPMGPRTGAETNTIVWLELAVNVGSEDINELSVEAHAGVRMSGRVELEGSGTTRPPDLAAIQLTIEAADAIAGSRFTSATERVDRSGEFRSRALPGGRYYVRVSNSPAGWMFKSATVDGRDVADTPVSLAADLSNVVVTFTDRWSGVRGFVQNKQGADGGAAVIVFPTDRDTWASSGPSARRVRIVRAGKTGDYSLNLPPGDYHVIAVPDAQAADWQDPVFLDGASRAAARITIAEGERKMQDLRTRDIR